MRRLEESYVFPSEQEAEDYAKRYREAWSGQFNPYDGKAKVIPPAVGASDQRFIVECSRNNNAD